MKTMREIIDSLNEARLASKKKIDEVFGMSREEKRQKILAKLRQFMTKEDVAADMGMSIEEIDDLINDTREKGGFRLPGPWT